MCWKKQFESGLTKGYYIKKIKEILESFSDYVPPSIANSTKLYLIKSEALQNISECCLFDYQFNENS